MATWFQKTFTPNKLKIEEAQKKFDLSRGLQLLLLGMRQKKHGKANKAIKEIFDNWPELADDKPFIDELEKGLEGSGQTLKDVADQIETKGGTYLDQLSRAVGKSKQDLIRSEAEARTGLEKGLKIRRGLAKRTTLPGQQAIEDKLSETTTGALSNIKRYGGGRGLSALADIYKQEQEQKRNLGISAAEFQTQMDLGLAGAEEQAGTTMADIIARNAGMGANMSSTLYGAQSDWLGKLATAKTNVAGQQERTAGMMYDVKTRNQMNQYLYNELYPTQAKLSWQQTRSQMTDPFSAQLQFLGEESGFARADMAQAIEQRNRNRELIAKLGIEGAKAIATGGMSLPFSAASARSGGTGSNMWGNPSFINPSGQYNEVDRYFPNQ